MVESRRLSVVETAKLVRGALKRAFPETKFSVKSSRYAGGASIDVNWEDGPLATEVSTVAGAFQGGGFDSMIDMMHYKTHYLTPAGEVGVYYEGGTLGSAGTVPTTDNRAVELPEGSEIVSFGADFVFVRRDVSDYDTKYAEACKYIYEHSRFENPTTGNPYADRMTNGNWVSNVAHGMTQNYVEGDDLEVAYDKARNVYS